MNNNTNNLRNFYIANGGTGSDFDKGTAGNNFTKTAIQNSANQYGMLQEQATANHALLQNALTNLSNSAQLQKENIASNSSIRGISGGLAQQIQTQQNRNQSQKEFNLQTNAFSQQLQTNAQAGALLDNLNQLLASAK